MEITKTARKIISCLVLINFLSYGIPVYAQDESLSQGNSSGLKAEVYSLRTKVDQLEKTVAGQAELIAQQTKVLEKIAEVVPEVKAMLAPPEPKTMIKKFVVSGARLFSAEELEKVLVKYQSKELSMNDLKKAADDITALYRKKGYLVSLAYLPPQEISGDTVEFNVVEGRVGEITVEKPKYSKPEVIRRRFLVEKGQILNSARIESSLKQINKQPDRTVRAVLSPGATPETSDILLKVENERSPHHFSAELNNRGTRYTSLNRWGLGYRNTNLLGNDDILALRFIANSKTEVYSGSAVYDMPVSRYNTRAGAYVAYSKADIGGQFAVPGLSPTGHAELWGLYVTHPWLDKEFVDEDSGSSLTLTSNLTAGLDSLSVYNKIMGNETAHDELRILKAGINFEEKDNLGRTGLLTEAHFGIPEFLGSMDKHDESASRIDSGGEFQKYTGSISRVTRLPGQMYLINSFKGQYTPFALVSGAQMTLGGADSVRGFQENEYLADYGWINTVELRMPPFLLPSILKVPFDKKHTMLIDAVQVVGFIDAGKGYVNKPRVGEVNEKFLVGAGFGFRFDLYEHLRAGGVIGTIENPYDVNITSGGLWVWAGSQNREVSANLRGTVVSSADTERVEIFEPSPPGLVIFDNHLMGGGNYGSGSANGSILSRGYGYIDVIRNDFIDSVYARALQQPWGYKLLLAWAFAEGPKIDEKFMSDVPTTIDAGLLNLPVLYTDMQKPMDYYVIRSIR